jgi:ribosomal protein L15
MWPCPGPRMRGPTTRRMRRVVPSFPYGPCTPAFSASARERIEAAGGTCVVLGETAGS